MYVAFIIPGPSPPSNLNPFNEIYLEEIKVMQKRKELVWHAGKSQEIQLAGTVCMFVLDEPGAAKNGGWSSHGAYHACPGCILTGKY